MTCGATQGGGGTRIPNQGSEGGGPAEGQKKNGNPTNFDSGSGRWRAQGILDGSPVKIYQHNTLALIKLLADCRSKSQLTGHALAKL